jgi:MoaA/NifB/PqqE/SkfB family radical SAM enzyme
MRVVELVFTGGNPLLRNDIEEVLKYSYEKFPVVSIFDNGSIAYKKIGCLKFVDAVCISLNTLNSALQDNMSGVSGAFQSAMRSIEKLKSAGIRTVVSITISDANVNEVANLIEHFGRREIEILLCLYSDVSSPDSLVKIGTEDSSFKFKSKDAMIKLIEQLKKLKKKYLIHIDSKTTQSLYNLFSSGTRDWICGALTSFFVVNEQGDISGCNIMPAICKIWDLPALWSSNQINEIRQKNRQCTKCTYLCYIAYSNVNNFSNLVKYALNYELHHFFK